tara:strand:+ start:2942 stop:3262 length:321 start_codon:yes stop_codon:yes gene_type:complete
MNDFQLTEYCNDIAADIVDGARDIDEAMDRASESADGSEHVIYNHKAHALCAGCDTDQGEDFLADCYGNDHGKSYDELACIIAYGETYSRIQSAIHAIFEANEAAA